jgi:hypothetical protein
MIKKILSLLIISILLFALSSCDLIYKKRDGAILVEYVATYEEVEASLSLLNEYDFLDNKFIFFDFLENSRDITYSFHKISPTPDSPENLEDFLNDERSDFGSWYAQIFLDNYCPYTEDCYYGEFIGNFDTGEHRVCISVCCNLLKSPTITDPELLTLKEQKGKLGPAEYLYRFSYDGVEFLLVKSCQELSAEIIEEFREAILDAYSS